MCSVLAGRVTAQQRMKSKFIHGMNLLYYIFGFEINLDFPMCTKKRRAGCPALYIIWRNIKIYCFVLPSVLIRSMSTRTWMSTGMVVRNSPQLSLFFSQNW